LHITGWRYLLTSLVSMIPAVLPPAALVGWAWFWCTNPGRNEGARISGTRITRTYMAEILPMLAAAAALVFSAWPRWTADALLHTMALSWFLCALLVYRWTRPRQRFWLGGVALLLAASSVVSKAIAPLDYWPRETRVGTLRDPGEEGEVLERLEHHIQPGDSLFSFPYMPSAYYFLNARNPSRYSFLQPGMMTREDEQRALADLQAAPPHWVIYEKYPAETVLSVWPGSDPALIPMTSMNGYIASHYRSIDTVNGQWGRLEVMERIP
jgi:hypothetical protein